MIKLEGKGGTFIIYVVRMEKKVGMRMEYLWSL
jgi:hypothetical protein